MQANRRDFLKTQALTASAAAAGIPITALGAPAATPAAAADAAVRWDKAPCRFCGTGCGVLVGVQDGRVVATQGDPDAPVKTVQTSYWELHCRMQDGSGDGTVPVSSGSAPIKHARNGGVRQQIKAPGFDHEASYANPLAQHFTLYSLIKIAAKAKRPLCVN